MRIIAGKNRGKKINLPKDKLTRPLRDVVKESIYNLLIHSNKLNFQIENKVILDLFSGSGSFGLEAISRNAKKVFFVENYENATDILKKNILDLRYADYCSVIKEDCFEFVNKKKYFKNEYDLIFMDPPYKEKKINSIIDSIYNNKILNKNGIIIIHRHLKDDLILSKNLNIIETRSYGISKIIFANLLI